MDMGDTIASFAESVGVLRYPPVVMVEGRAVSNKPATVTMSASVQPATPRDVQRLPENLREQETIAVFTTYDLRGASVEGRYQGDRVKWEGRDYEVKSVQRWRAAGNYVKALCTRVGQ